MVGAVCRPLPPFRFHGFTFGQAQVMAMGAIDMMRTARSRLQPVIRVALGTVVMLLAVSQEAHASFLSPELEDKLATFLALLVLFIVPVVLIVLFWMVHILPEKIAHQRHHPQFEAIRTLCLLSLVFGGLLWPLAWLWAYSKPVMYKMAYGTDKHPDALEDGHAAEDFSAAESLQDRLARLESRVPASELAPLRADLAALEAKFKRSEVL
jgi:CBS domain containing-hemolysin-like protein